jgi:signal transduction histidine kinase
MTRRPAVRSLGRVLSLRRDTAIDVALCVAMLAYGLPPTFDASVTNPHATTWGPILLPTLVVSVLLRRRWPLGAALGFAAACVISGVPTFDQFRLIVAVPAALLIVYALAVGASRARALTGLGIVLAGLAFVGASERALQGVGGVVSMLAFSGPLCLAVWGAGRIVRSREHLAAQLQTRSRHLLEQREVTAALAVEIDRERLAADLDLAARSRLHEMIELAVAPATGSAEDRARFARIELLGRDSLDQMRTLLGLLRSFDRGARAPRPTLEQLEALLAAARAGGRTVDLEVAGERRQLSAGVELAAYRMVQHGLNALESRGERPAHVALRYMPDRLELQIEGRRAAGSAAGAALVAARERVLAIGGSFTSATSTPDRQILHARLPAIPIGA